MKQWFSDSNYKHTLMHDERQKTKGDSNYFLEFPEYSTVRKNLGRDQSSPWTEEVDVGVQKGQGS